MNTLKTNKLTDLVALRMLATSGFLTVGAKAYFKDQLVGKRNGQTYGFVIRDTGTAAKGLSVDKLTQKTNIVEKQIDLTLDPWHIYIESNAIEGVTDLTWDEEVAKPNGKKLGNKVVRDAVEAAVSKPAVTFIGSGFQPLAEASAHIGSITDEEMYGFTDPKIQAVLTSNGQQFNPVGSPSTLYSKGLLGEFHNVEYRSQRFFPQVKVAAGLANLLNGATAKVVVKDAAKATVTVTYASSGTYVGNVPKGLPVMIEGVYACDLVGDVTSNLYSFIVPSNISASGGSFAFDVDLPTTAVGGTMQIAKADGTAWDITVASGDLKDLDIVPIEAGTYFMAQIRANGAYEFETLDKLDTANKETKIGSVEGITVHENRVLDLMNMVNGTRWDIVSLSGVVENRAVANVLIKA